MSTSGPTSFLAAPGAIVVADFGRGGNGGIAVGDLDGGRRYTVLAGRGADPVVGGRLLYARDHRRHTTHVFDLATGRLERRLAQSSLPRLIPLPPAP